MGVAFTPLLDDQWIVAVVERIEALPVTDADVMDAYTVGIVDAEHGKPCEPLAHFAKLGEIESYIIGWQDATFAINEALDLRDGIEFGDFVRGGC